MNFTIEPLTLGRANALVAAMHRHHKPVVGHRFSLGAWAEGVLVGAIVVGRPVARNTNPDQVAEVTRLVTNGARNACSVLYAAAARVAREMGFCRIQTFILESEPGTSLVAAGWSFDHKTSGGDWNSGGRKRRRDQPMGPKQCWTKVFRGDCGNS